VGQELWNEEFLTASRQVGDARADEAIRRIFAAGDMRELQDFMGRLVLNSELPTDLPDELRAFLDETEELPKWHRPDLVRQAEVLFNIHGLVSLVSLVLASLPECYTMKTGVQILALTGQLGEHTNRRLHQTAVMVLAVMGKDGLGAHGQGIRQAQKVRLIHAAIRFRILSAIGTPGFPAAAGAGIPRVVEGARRSVVDVIEDDAFTWNNARDGYPINQEDLAFTLLTFGYVIPRAMITLGVPLTDDEFESFLHAWNCIGYVMGVDERLMAHTVKDASVLFDRIKARQAGASDAGRELTDALLSVVERKVLNYRVLWPIAPAMLRMLVGSDTATLLGLSSRHSRLVFMLHGAISGVVTEANRIGRKWFRIHPLRRLATKIGRHLVEAVTEATYGKKNVQVQIPPEWL
jgi:hypothetical protein